MHYIAKDERKKDYHIGNVYTRTFDSLRTAKLLFVISCGILSLKRLFKNLFFTFFRILFCGGDHCIELAFYTGLCQPKE